MHSESKLALKCVLNLETRLIKKEWELIIMCLSSYVLFGVVTINCYILDPTGLPLLEHILEPSFSKSLFKTSVDESKGRLEALILNECTDDQSKWCTHYHEKCISSVLLLLLLLDGLTQW